MLSFKFISDSGGATHYFEQSDDYYAKDGSTGTWTGEGAERLGLKDGVDMVVFKQLLEGQLPNGEIARKAMPRYQSNGKRSKERLGIDFTFSAPKSVSIAALVNGDREILRAHDEAVKATLKAMESKAIARQKIKGKSFRLNTGNLAVATFRHDLSRTQDPQLHTHSVIMNLTQRDDGRWVALTNDELLKSVKLYGAYYRADLAQRLEKMGYELRSTRDGFEMSHVSDKAIQLFSKRSKQIEAELEKKGLSRETAGGEAKQKITQATRPTKNEADREALRKEWVQVLEEAGITLKKSPDGKYIELPVKPEQITPSAPKTPTPSIPERIEPTMAPRSPGLPDVVSITPTPTETPSKTPKKPRNSEKAEKVEAVRQIDEKNHNKERTINAPEAVPITQKQQDLTPQEIAKRSVDFAINHMAERQGIFTMSEIQEKAYLRSMGHFDEIEKEIVLAQKDGRLIAELPLYQTAKSFTREKHHEANLFQYNNFKQEGEREKLSFETWVALTMTSSNKTQEQAEKIVSNGISSGRLVESEKRFTTGDMLKSEREILAMEERGRNQVTPIHAAETIKELFKESTLNKGQLEAASMILTSPNRVIGIQGFAGVGKSHALKETKEKIQEATVSHALAQGYTVIGIAPYNSQVKALAELGMESQTLASFLIKTKEQEKLGPKTIVFLDEASVVPAYQMKDLMRLVEAKDSRLVLIGDRKQTQAVEAGKPFEQLQDNGMTVAHITEIQRQKNDALRAAVVNAASGKIDVAVRILDGRTTQITIAEKRYEAIAKEYVNLTEEQRNSTLIITGTNTARLAINEAVRSRLSLGEDHQVNTFSNVDMTKAEKQLASSFSQGQVVLLEGTKHSQGLERRTYYEVIAVDAKKNLVTVETADKRQIVFNPATVGQISAFQKEIVPLAVNDWIRVTRNNSQQGVVNGGRYQVISITPETVHLSNGSVLSRTDPLHLQHGYAATVHSAQGLTKDRVIIDADSKSLTSNRAVFYVAISRPVNYLSIYTDKKSVLADVMKREPKKYAALELRNDDLEKTFLREAMKRQALRKELLTPKHKAKGIEQDALRKKGGIRKK